MNAFHKRPRDNIILVVFNGPGQDDDDGDEEG